MWWARLADGTTLREGVAPYLSIPQSRLITFGYDFPGLQVSVDIPTGVLHIGEESIIPEIPDSPLRLIYYNRMSCTTGNIEPICEFVAIGWQTTHEGKNLRFGMKVYPREMRWEVTEEL